MRMLVHSATTVAVKSFTGTHHSDSSAPPLKNSYTHRHTPFPNDLRAILTL